MLFNNFWNKCLECNSITYVEWKWTRKLFQDKTKVIVRYCITCAYSMYVKEKMFTLLRQTCCVSDILDLKLLSINLDKLKILYYMQPAAFWRYFSSYLIISRKGIKKVFFSRRFIKFLFLQQKTTLEKFGMHWKHVFSFFLKFFVL